MVDLVKLHFGAGTLIKDGWINVDAWVPDCVKFSMREEVPSRVWEKTNEVQRTVTRFIKLQSPNDLSCIEGGSLDEIYSCHVIEHFSPNDAYCLMGEFQRMLKPGGKMHHITPDVDSMIDLWQKMMREAEPELFYAAGEKPSVPHFDYERYITIVNGVLCPWDGVMKDYPGHKSLWNKTTAKFILNRWGFDNVDAKTVGTDLHFKASAPTGEYNTIRA